MRPLAWDSDGEPEHRHVPARRAVAHEVVRNTFPRPASFEADARRPQVRGEVGRCLGCPDVPDADVAHGTTSIVGIRCISLWREFAMQQRSWAW